jgi:hypothetical protein
MFPGFRTVMLCVLFLGDNTCRYYILTDTDKIYVTGFKNLAYRVRAKLVN